MRITNVAVPIIDGIDPFGTAATCEIFGRERGRRSLPTYRFALASLSGRPVRTTGGFSIVAPHGAERIAEADLVIVPPGPWARGPVPGVLVNALVAARRRGAHVVGLCAGAFAVAAAGLLDGRRATTHWRLAEEMASRYPRVHVDAEALYVDEGVVSTAAGTSAAIDLGLHLVRRAHGPAVAAELARDLLVPPHRAGGQAQFARPASGDPAEVDRLAQVLAWTREHLADPLAVPDLASRAYMSVRTFTRRFRAATGMSPQQWITSERVSLAETLLETTNLSVEEIARRTGFSSGAVLRHHFARVLGTTPAAHRRAALGVCPDSQA